MKRATTPKIEQGKQKSVPMFIHLLPFTRLYLAQVLAFVMTTQLTLAPHYFEGVIIITIN
jgi:hypothetical protein